MTPDQESEILSQQRKNYYDKWDSFTKEEVKKAKEEEEEEKEKADEELGLKNAINSKEQAEDSLKREALKEAKKKWEDKELSDAQKKYFIEDYVDKEKVMDSVKLHWKPVIVFKNNKNSKFKIPHNLKHKLVKVFIENCTNCEFDFEVISVTQHLEVTHSNDCIFRIKQETSTVQLDICENVTVEYGPGLFKGEKVRIYHACVKGLKVEANERIPKTHSFSYTNETFEDDNEDEVQFITHLKGGEIVTERVIRDKGNLPATKDEVDEHDLTERTFFRDAELKKVGGNEAFKERHYSQAAVFYTEAMNSLEKARTKKQIPEGEDFTHILFQNRAFCWQKLGHHEKAEDDARKSIEIKPDYCKALFRLGLALHAQNKYFEAVPILGKASNLEPKNEAIKQALGFAEMNMRKMMRGDD